MHDIAARAARREITRKPFDFHGIVQTRMHGRPKFVVDTAGKHDLHALARVTAVYSRVRRSRSQADIGWTRPRRGTPRARSKADRTKAVTTYGV